MPELFVDRREVRRRVDADPERGWCREEYGARLFGVESIYDTLAALLRAAATWSARRFVPARPIGPSDNIRQPYKSLVASQGRPPVLSLANPTASARTTSTVSAPPSSPTRPR
jgi:hypothetical protein